MSGGPPLGRVFAAHHPDIRAASNLSLTRARVVFISRSPPGPDLLLVGVQVQGHLLHCTAVKEVSGLPFPMAHKGA
jgi:hypothetical protein